MHSLTSLRFVVISHLFEKKIFFCPFFFQGRNSFPSAKIFSGFEINQAQAEIISITQKKKSAILEVLSEFLDVEDTVKLSLHGCWCTRITGYNPKYAGDPVDEIDHLCKEWSSKRRCNTLMGGTCPYNIMTGNSYTIKKSLQNNDNSFSCETDENNLDTCLKDSCIIDATYAQAIQEAMKIDPGWSLQKKTALQCTREVDHLGGINNLSGNNYDSICVGSAPNLEVQRVD